MKLPGFGIFGLNATGVEAECSTVSHPLQALIQIEPQHAVRLNQHIAVAVVGLQQIQDKGEITRCSKEGISLQRDLSNQAHHRDPGRPANALQLLGDPTAEKRHQADQR